jgi:hypothetical protein
MRASPQTGSRWPTPGMPIVRPSQALYDEKVPVPHPSNIILMVQRKKERQLRDKKDNREKERRQKERKEKEKQERERNTGEKKNDRCEKKDGGVKEKRK